MIRLPGILRFARMAGSSVAAPGAAAWVTDFMNAAYYARDEEEREVRDLRLAHGIITTLWSNRRGRLGARDLFALHRAYWRLRRASSGRLDHDDLLEGATHLLGEWFPEAWLDDDRRAWGIAFRDVGTRDEFRPEDRLKRAALGSLTPPLRDPSEQHWATYDPVALPDPDVALALLGEPPRWPDIGSANGRFTPLRDTGLEDQTFEIEVVAEPTPRSPVFTRGYVTCTTLLLRGQGEAADTALVDGVEQLTSRYFAGAGEDAPPIMGPGGQPLALIVLTTHEGHFLGRALSHLLVWRDADGSWIRDIGAWDPLPAHLAAAYSAAGETAQNQFWGPTPAERSMLAQLALAR